MPAHSSPTVRRRQLAAELRRLRQAAKLTIEQVAETLEWSPGKVSRIENARNSVNQRDTRRLIDLYGVDDRSARDALLALARQSRERGQWQQLGQGLQPWFVNYIGLEAGASSINRFQSELIPGLAQTRSYAEAVHQAAAINADPEEIERQVSIRMERQARLSDPNAPQLWMVLNEAVIRRVVGDREVMHDQLSKLVEMSEMPNVTIQILDFGSGAHAALDSGFALLEFDEPASGAVAYVEFLSGAVYIERPDEVQRYRLAFDHLRAVSLAPSESLRVLRRAIDDFALYEGQLPWKWTDLALSGASPRTATATAVIV